MDPLTSDFSPVGHSSDKDKKYQEYFELYREKYLIYLKCAFSKYKLDKNYSFTDTKILKCIH